MNDGGPAFPKTGTFNEDSASQFDKEIFDKHPGPMVIAEHGSGRLALDARGDYLTLPTLITLANAAYEQHVATVARKEPDPVEERYYIKPFGQTDGEDDFLLYDSLHPDAWIAAYKGYGAQARAGREAVYLNESSKAATPNPPKAARPEPTPERYYVTSSVSGRIFQVLSRPHIRCMATYETENYGLSPTTAKAAAEAEAARLNAKEPELPKRPWRDESDNDQLLVRDKQGRIIIDLSKNTLFNPFPGRADRWAAIRSIVAHAVGCVNAEHNWSTSPR